MQSDGLLGGSRTSLVISKHLNRQSRWLYKQRTAENASAAFFFSLVSVLNELDSLAKLQKQEIKPRDHPPAPPRPEPRISRRSIPSSWINSFPWIGIKLHTSGTRERKPPSPPYLQSYVPLIPRGGPLKPDAWNVRVTVPGLCSNSFNKEAP